MNFFNFGYYIIKPVLKPDYISLGCKQILTASECICDLHPMLDGSFWLNHNQEQKEYQALLKLSDKEFADMKETVNELYSNHHLDNDSRFIKYSDALSFHHKYLYHLPEPKVVALALTDKYQNVLWEDMDKTSNILSFLEHIQSDASLLGYDILGWDGGGFHTYLCNGLDKDISAKYPLMTNDFGIIQNSYNLVESFAEYIRDKGEPVHWLPFAIFEYIIK